MVKFIKDVFKRIFKDLFTYRIAIIVCIVYYLVTLNLFKASCPFILVTGFPCPGCGITRSLIAIFTFRFGYAFTTNPASYAWLLFLIYFVIVRYILGRKMKHVYLILGAVALITIGVYVYGMITYFPNRIPYVYTSHNLLHYAAHLRSN